MQFFLTARFLCEIVRKMKKCWKLRLWLGASTIVVLPEPQSPEFFLDL